MKLMPVAITRKTITTYLISLPIGIITFFLIFILGYILKLPLDVIPFIGLVTLLDALVIWLLLKGLGITPMFSVIIPSVVVGFLITITYMGIAHDYAMWKICYPQITRQPADIQNELDKKSTTRNYYQHVECENNILPFPWGKQAKFSQNPPGFIPK